MLIRDERSITVSNSIKSMFARHGILENVISDNGRQYTSDEFKEFSRNINLSILRLLRNTLEEIQ